MINPFCTCSPFIDEPCQTCDQTHQANRQALAAALLGDAIAAVRKAHATLTSTDARPADLAGLMVAKDQLEDIQAELLP